MAAETHEETMNTQASIPRKIVIPLLGLLVIIIVSALIFLQSSPQPTPDEGGAIAGRQITARANDSGTQSIPPSAASRSGEEARPELDRREPGPESPALMMHELLASLSAMKPEERGKEVIKLLAKLREQGPAGLQAASDYLRVGQDLKIGNGIATINGQLLEAPTLRYAVISALRDWPGNEDLHVTREVLGFTTRLSEAGLLVQQLEAQSPGGYKAEAIQAMLKAGSLPQQEVLYDGGRAFFDAMRNYQAPELIPAAENLAQRNAFAGMEYIQALGELPQNVWGPAVDRFFANPDLVRQFATNPNMLRGLNYSNPSVAGNAARFFATGMDQNAKENFLASTGMPQMPQPFNSKVPDPETQATQAQARLTFLNQIAPQCTTAVLQARLQTARDALQETILKTGKNSP
jgi:hypothetical protein